MRAFEFLLEYNQQITARSFGKQLLQVAQKDPDAMKLLLIPNDDIEDPSEDDDIVTLLTAFETSDAPGSKMDNVPWMIKRYIAGDFKFNQLPQVTAILTDFMAIKPRLKGLGVSIDLNQYTVIDLRDKLKDLNSTDIDIDGPGKKIDIDIGIPDVKVLYHGPLGKLYIPLTEEASCKIGAGTKWCTAATGSTNHFNSYNDDGPLYIWIDKSKKKFQFHLNSSEFRFDVKNSADRTPNISVMRSFKSHPVIKQILVYAENKMLEWVEEQPSFENVSNLIDYIKLFELRLPVAEPFMLLYASLALEYALCIIKGQWPAAEPIIESDEECNLSYTVRVLHQLVSEEQEQEMLDSNPWLVIDYSNLVIGGRWVAAEPTIMKYTQSAILYAKDVIKGRWPELEPNVMKAPEYIVDYAKNVIKGRWPEAEDKVMKDPEYIVDYAKNVIKGRWPEAEDKVMKDPVSIVRYAVSVIKDRWPEAESSILKSNSTLIVMYAHEVIKGRWPEAEKKILTGDSVDDALEYASGVIKGPWPEAEHLFIQDSLLASLYAQHCLQHRWPEAEERIAEAGGYPAISYALNVMKSRWPEAEPNMENEELYGGYMLDEYHRYLDLYVK